MSSAKDSDRHVIFEKGKGCFLPRWVCIALIVGVALCMIFIGLLVGYLTPYCQNQILKKVAEKLQASKTAPYIRLPRSIVPEHYDIELQPYLIENNFTFDGKVKIVIKVLEPTDNVTLHINNITVDAESVKLTDAQSRIDQEIVSKSQDEEKEFYILHLKRKLKKGLVYEIYIEYVGYLNDLLVGFYRSSYLDADGNKRWLATTQFWPTDARRAFPCFDEPAMKATFSITIVRWRNMTSLSNMPKYKTGNRDVDWVADYFEKTVRMSTYLIAFVVSDFQNRGNSQFSVWSREGMISTTEYAANIGPKILNFYANFFNVPYPLPKTDMVAIPDFRFGAMENWGLILYTESKLLYDERYSSAGDKEGVASTVAHELAHQWFGNLVTPAWWDDLWLNEGFANYVQYLGMNTVHPEWRMDEQFVLDQMHKVMNSDCLKTSHPISLPVRHPDEINEILDVISYSKGACIIRMMRYFLGEKNFHTGLTNYLNAKKFGSATQDDLWEHLTSVQNQHSPVDVKTVMDSWTLQTGYPIVEVIRNYADGTAKVNQYRFLLEKSEDSKNENYLWEIPLTYTTGLNPSWRPDTRLWLHKTNGTISGLPSSNHWIVANLQQIGYYIVNYDGHNWQLLTEQLMNDHKKIHPINRAQIIHDAMELARAGQLSYHLALNLTMYLKEEKDYLPWTAALNAFSYIDRMIHRSSANGMWMSYVKDQIKPLYEWLGWEESSDESNLIQYMRVSTLSWMCKYEYKDCVEKAQGKFEEWKQDPLNFQIIPPSLRTLVFCSAVQHGGENAWKFVWERYKTSQVASEKEKYLDALSCAREPWLLNMFLNRSLTDESGIRLQDGPDVFRAVGSSRYGQDITFKILRDKWNIIFKRYGKSFNMGDFIGSVASSFNTEFELFQLKELYKVHMNNLGTAERAFQQSLEYTKANVRWKDSYYGNLVEWLKIATNA